jgi:integrase
VGPIWGGDGDHGADAEYAAHDKRQSLHLLRLLLTRPRSAKRRHRRPAVVTGMRQGELLALKWPDVDLRDGRASNPAHHITKSGGRLLLGEPKTAKSRRTHHNPNYRQLERPQSPP